MLDENFVWIGAYEFQYLIGRDAFLKSIESESQEAPVHVSQEEYHLLAHDRNIWTVYGRFTATIVQDDGTFLMAKTRNTFVLQQVGDDLFFLHIHGSHARDVPLEYKEAPPSLFQEKESWLENLKSVDRLVGPPKRLNFRTTDGIYRFPLPAEIVYMVAENKNCTVFTKTDSFVTRTSLKEVESQSPLFALIHRAYLVNVRFVREICRYQLTLTDGTQLPIGKERYLEVKEALRKQEKSVVK